MTDICLKFGTAVQNTNCVNIVYHNLIIGYIQILFPACVSKFGIRFDVVTL
jgi:hypothetical protein